MTEYKKNKVEIEAGLASQLVGELQPTISIIYTKDTEDLDVSVVVELEDGEEKASVRLTHEW